MSNHPSMPEVKVQASQEKKVRMWAAWFTFIFVLVLLAFGVYSLFSHIAVENYTSDELYSKLTDGRRETQRMAATEWSRMLLEESGKVKPDMRKLLQMSPTPEQTARLGRVLIHGIEDAAGAEGVDATYLSAVATLLGFSSDSPSAKKFLSEYLQTTRDKNLQQDAQLYALISLSRLGNLSDAELQLLITYTRSANPNLRKTAGYALGAANNLNSDGTEALTHLISDSVEDVRWNGALALTRLGRSEGIPILKQVLDEAKADHEITVERFTLYQEVLNTAMRSKIAELRDVVGEIAHSHPNLKLRQAAKDAVY